VGFYIWYNINVKNVYPVKLDEADDSVKLDEADSPVKLDEAFNYLHYLFA